MPVPCATCGGTETELIDGFYYCVECGTQDVTVMDTVVERFLDDGTHAIGARKKIPKKKHVIQMSGEWHKWHAYNFIISGLADEVILLGAAPSFKAKLLWIWVRYIQKFNVKEEYDKTNADQNLLDEGDSENDENNIKMDKNENQARRNVDYLKKITILSFKIVYSMIFCALNLDKSEIQASDVIRFIAEGRISFKSALKYVPKDLNVSKIPEWAIFERSCHHALSLQSLLYMASSLFVELDLGTPLVPNLGCLVTRYCKELCLPKEFRGLVMSLLELLPPEIYFKLYWRFIALVPDFEGIVMSYIVVGLKMCFGLDDDYDLNLTYVVNEINDEENHLKAFKIGEYEPTNRLFSFGEWLKYLEFRKLLLCKFYQPMSLKYNIGINNFLITESSKDLPKTTKGRVVDVRAFELLNTIPQDRDFKVLAKESFPCSTTPLTAYTEHILLNATVEDPGIRLLLSEDFSKYSLDYACLDLELKFSAASENIIKGIAEFDKDRVQVVKNSLNDTIIKGENWAKYVFIKNGDTKNNGLHKFIQIKSHTGDHVDLETIEEEDDLNNFVKRKEIDEINTIEELDKGDDIFGVNFSQIENELELTEQPHDNHNFDDFGQTEDRDDTVLDFINESQYDPQNFNREVVIRSLILRYCSKYKVPIPYEYKDLAKTVSTKNKAKDNDVKLNRKPREVYSGALSGNTILKMFKNVMDNMVQDTATVSRNIGVPYDIKTDTEMNIDNIINNGNDINIDTDLHSNADTVILGQSENINTDGMGLVPTVTEGSTTNNNTFHVDDNDDVFTLPPTQSEGMDIETEQNDEPIANLDVIDIILGEVNKYKEDNLNDETEQRKEKFSKRDKVPLAKLFAKDLVKTRDRSHLMPYLSDPEAIKQFYYYALRFVDIKARHIRNRSITFETEMLNHFPQSYRYVLQTCASIVESNAYQLFKFVQCLEDGIANSEEL